MKDNQQSKQNIENKVKREMKTRKDKELPKVKKESINPRENWNRDMNRQFTGKKEYIGLNTRWLTQDERNTKNAERSFHT